MGDTTTMPDGTVIDTGSSIDLGPVGSAPVYQDTPGTWVDSSGGVYANPQTTVAPSQNSAQWAAFASSLAKGGLTLAEINSIQPGTVVSANGAILRQNPGYSVPVANIGTQFSSLFSTAGVSSNILLTGGLLIGGLFLASMFKGGR